MSPDPAGHRGDEKCHKRSTFVKLYSRFSRGIIQPVREKMHIPLGLALPGRDRLPNPDQGRDASARGQRSLSDPEMIWYTDFVVNR